MIKSISSICVALIILFGTGINCKGICGNEDSETDKDNKPTEYGREGIDKLEVDSSALLDNAERPYKTSCKDLKRVEARDGEEYGSIMKEAWTTACMSVLLIMNMTFITRMMKDI